MIYDQLKSQGFENEVGGGGCVFLSRYFPNGAAIWVTGEGGPSMPSDDDWLMCVYGRRPDGDMSDALFSSASGDVGFPDFNRSLHSVITFAHGLDAAQGMETAQSAAAPVIYVEVSAWAERDGAVHIVNEKPETAHGYGVYIRAPLAYHMTDFDVPRFMRELPEAHAAARAAAFDFAADLAAGLECKVESALPPVVKPVSLSDMMEAGACLWEAAMEFQDRWQKDGPSVNAPYKTAFLAEWGTCGTADMRSRILDMAEACHREWDAAIDAGEFDESFDWEWCPAWLAGQLEKRWATSHRMMADPVVNGRVMIAGDILGLRDPAIRWAIRVSPVRAGEGQ